MGCLNPGGKIILGDVATETSAAMAAASKRDLARWDDAETYLVAQNCKAWFPTHEHTFTACSYCSGVIVIKSTS